MLILTIEIKIWQSKLIYENIHNTFDIFYIILSNSKKFENENIDFTIMPSIISQKYCKYLPRCQKGWHIPKIIGFFFFLGMCVNDI
jgi:hypothetical protein